MSLHFEEYPIVAIEAGECGRVRPVLDFPLPHRNSSGRKAWMKSSRRSRGYAGSKKHRVLAGRLDDGAADGGPV